jgi:hypothetical protein
VEHVVFFPAPDGTPAFRRFAGLEEAVRFVEHLRNVENVSEASVHALTEVPLAFKAWYRVELPSAAEPSGVDTAAVDFAAVNVAVPAAADFASSIEPAPHLATIADAIETYSHPRAVPSPAVLPDAGSVTGIVVPDQPFIAVDQFGAPPVPASPGAAALSDRPVPAEDERRGEGHLLEPAFGAPRSRERGNGYFVR